MFLQIHMSRTLHIPEQIKHVKPVHPGELSFMIQEYEQDTEVYLNELLKVSNADSQRGLVLVPNTGEPWW